MTRTTMRHAFHVIQCLLAIVSWSIVPGSVCAEESNRKDADKLYQHATALYGLGHYDAAGAEYEKAFELDLQPAYLFDAAQAFRRADRKQRALELYRNYVAIFGHRAEKYGEANRYIQALEKALLADEHARTSPPVSLQSTVPPIVNAEDPKPRVHSGPDAGRASAQKPLEPSRSVGTTIVNTPALAPKSVGMPAEAHVPAGPKSDPPLASSRSSTLPVAAAATDAGKFEPPSSRRSWFRRSGVWAVIGGAVAVAAASVAFAVAWPRDPTADNGRLCVGGCPR